MSQQASGRQPFSRNAMVLAPLKRQELPGFPPELDTKVNLSKVNLEVLQPWIATRITELMGGVEDEVLIGAAAATARAWPRDAADARLPDAGMVCNILSEGPHPSGRDMYAGACRTSSLWISVARSPSPSPAVLTSLPSRPALLSGAAHGGLPAGAVGPPAQRRGQRAAGGAGHRPVSAGRQARGAAEARRRSRPHAELARRLPLRRRRLSSAAATAAVAAPSSAAAQATVAACRG